MVVYLVASSMITLESLLIWIWLGHFIVGAEN